MLHDRVEPMTVFSRVFGSWEVSVARRPFATHDLAAHYDAQSGTWQAVIEQHGFGAAYTRLFEKVFRKNRYHLPTRPLRVMDAGVGTGAMASAFRSFLGRAFHLDAIDISSAMLREAQARLRNQDISLTLTKADLSTLPFDTNTFDVILAAHVIEHVADVNAAMAELYRVLKPGGVLICCITRRSWLGAYIQLVWRTHRADIQTAKRWLRNAGFTGVRAVPLEKQSATRRFSIGYVGRKPDQLPPPMGFEPL